jgi:hypothetical protein
LQFFISVKRNTIFHFCWKNCKQTKTKCLKKEKLYALQKTCLFPLRIVCLCDEKYIFHKQLVWVIIFFLYKQNVEIQKKKKSMSLVWRKREISCMSSNIFCCEGIKCFLLNTFWSIWDRGNEWICITILFFFGFYKPKKNVSSVMNNQIFHNLIGSITLA